MLGPKQRQGLSGMPQGLVHPPSTVAAAKVMGPTLALEYAWSSPLDEDRDDVLLGVVQRGAVEQAGAGVGGQPRAGPRCSNA